MRFLKSAKQWVEEMRIPQHASELECFELAQAEGQSICYYCIARDATLKTIVVCSRKGK